MPTEQAIAYAAGLFDGEGTLYIDRNNRINLAISMTDKPTVAYLKEAFGGFTNEDGYKLRSGRLVYQWRTAGSLTIDVARAIYPYSRTKKRQLEVLLSYADRFPIRDKDTSADRDERGRFVPDTEDDGYVVRQIASRQLKALRLPSPVEVTMDIETMGLDPNEKSVLACTFMHQDDESSVWSLWREGPDDEERLLVEIRDELEAAPYTIGWNSSRFDIPFINTRLKLYGQRPMFLGSHTDADVVFDEVFNNSRRTSLVNAANQLGVTDEEVHKTPIAWDKWDAAHLGEKEALDYVIEHAKMDVILTKRVLNAIS